MPQVIETRDEFLARHGGNLLKVGERRWLLPTGASVTNDGFGAIFHEPPADPWENHEARRDYVQTQLERAEKDFRQLRGTLLGAVDHNGMTLQFSWDEKEYGPAPVERDCFGGPSGKAGLLRLKEIVVGRRAALSKIDNEPIARHRRKVEEERQRQLMEHEARLQEIQSQIAQIEI